MGRRRKEEEIEELLSETPQAVASVPNRGLEALGIVMLISAIGLCFALFSFDPRDTSGDGNLVGPMGVGLANVLLGGVGVVGYVVGLLCVAMAGAVMLGRVRLPSWLSILSALAITLGATVLAQLVSADPNLLGHPAGGAVGLVVAELVASVAGKVGAGLVAVALMLVGVLGISDLSFSTALRDVGRALSFCWLKTFGVISVYVVAQRAGKQRENELVEAARSRRAQVKLDQQEREKNLKEDLEEKKRLAVLKATAKAEEKALKKIAELEAKERLEQERLEREAAEEAEADEEEEEDEEEDLLAEDEAYDEEAEEDEDEEDDEIYDEDEDEEYDEDEEEDEEEEDEEEEDEEEEIALGIPGPGAEPEIIITDSLIEEEESLPPSELPDLKRAADVIEEIDRQTALPKKTLTEEEEGLLIHERKHVEADFANVVEEKKPKKTEYELPPINLLDYEGDPPEPIDEDLLQSKATRLEQKLRTYGVEGRVKAIRPGPVVTTYEYQPAPGVKVAKIANLADDIAMSMEALRVRIVAPIPGRGVVGIELPNEKRENVYLKELIWHDQFKKSKSPLTLAVGKDAEGEPEVRDLRKMPHLLLAGTTGSGKSVCINTMILSILYKATPEQVKFIMVDPKMLELSLYEDIPHLLLPVVWDPRKASLALAWAVDEMERRYQLLSDMKVREIDLFNKRLEKLKKQREADADQASLGLAEEEESDKPAKGRVYDPWRGEDLPESLPYIVVLIDEFADLMCVAPRDVEASVQRLAQKARAAGIHVLLATQRPSTDVITGVIKNNFPSRVSFRVASRHDSATILNAPGAENLLGMGDSLFLSVTSPAPTRIHGGFVSESEVERVVDFWKGQAKPNYDENILKKKEEDELEAARSEDVDEMYDQAVKIVTDTRKASISALQRRLRVGYNRAARMIEMMETEGVVGEPSGPKGEREVLARPPPE